MKKQYDSRDKVRLVHTLLPKLLIIIPFLFTSLVASSQAIVSSLAELKPYLKQDDIVVKLAPGTYSITAEDVANGLYQDETHIGGRVVKVLLLFEGNNSTYDFSGVTINVETAVFQAYGNHDVYEIQIVGNDNVLKNLTLVDNGSVHDRPARTALNICMDGARNRVEGFHVTVKGSYPYGYGDAFGKGGSYTIKHYKHSACLIRGESNHLKNSTFIHRSYGHCIFMQAASNPLIEGCYVEGEVRKTDDMLTETSGPAFDIDFMTEWGYRLPPGYMLSLAEAGIRAYNAGQTIIDGVEYSRGTSNPTVLNCTIKHMRTGVTVAHATGTKYVEGCTAIGCENGYSLASGDVVNCKADCAFGPVYSSTYESDRNYNADITIIPPSDPYYNGSGSVAYIGGSGHKITLRGTDEVLNMDLKIKVGGEKDNIRLLYGNLPHQNDFSASDFELNNLTNFPVFLSSKSSGISGKSGGMVTDLGTNNNLTPVEVSVKKLEAEEFTAMSGISTEVTSDEGDGENITSLDAGDWVEYEVNVPYSGTYSMSYRVASASADGEFSLSVGSKNLEDVHFTATSGEQSWTTISSSAPFYLDKGIQIIRVNANNGGWKLNWLDLILDCAEVPIVPYTEELNAQGISLSKKQTTDIEVFPGNTAILRPEPTVGGNWNWSGPNGFISNKRVIEIKDINESEAGAYQATFTNDCGQQSTSTFNVTVQGSLLVEAESYSSMSGVSIKTTSDVSGTENISSIDASDWVEYSLEVPVSATYHLQYRVAGTAPENTFQVYLDGQNIGEVNFSATGEQSWTTVSSNVPASYLTAGTHTIRLVSNTSGWKLSWLQLKGEDFVNPCSLPFSPKGFSIQNDTIEWTSGVIDISCVNKVNAYVALEEVGALSTSDYLNVYYKLDGGELVAISENTGTLHQYAAITRDLSGSTLELIIRAVASSHENHYMVSKINIVETSNPFERIEAEDYTDADGPRTGTTGDVDGEKNLGSIHPGHWSMYANIDLTDVKSINARLASVYEDGYIEVRLDAADGELIGTIDVPYTGNWQSYETVSAHIADVTGLYDVYLVYQTKESPHPCNINWFQFSEAFVAPPIDPYSRFEAENYDAESGTSLSGTSDIDGVKEVNDIQSGDWLMYSGLDFTEASSLDVRVASSNDNSTIEVRLDSVNGPIISFINMPNTDSKWETLNASLEKVEGEHNVYLLFKGEGANLLHLNWLQFKIYVNPYARIEVEDYDAKEWKKANVGGTSDPADEGVGSILKAIVPGDWVMFKDIDLTEANSVSARFGSLYDDAFVEVRTDSADGNLIGTIVLYKSGGWHNWETTHTNLQNLTGQHDVYFVFQTETSPNVANINWFQLSELRVEVPINPFSRIEAEDFSLSSSINVSPTSDVDGTEEVAVIEDGDWLMFSRLNFDEVGNLNLRVASPVDGASIELRSEAYDGELLATIDVPNTGATNKWKTANGQIDGVSGEHDIFLVFEEVGQGTININWLQFRKTPILIDSIIRIEAESNFSHSGVITEATTDVGDGEHISSAKNGDFITFDVDVKSEGIYELSFRLLAEEDQSIGIRSNNAILGELSIISGTEETSWQTIKSLVYLEAGKQTLQFDFYGKQTGILNLNWIEFEITGHNFSVNTKTKGATTDNSIHTYLEIVNSGNTGIPLEALTARYWFTAENYKPLNFWCDYAKLGKNFVHGSFSNSKPVRTGAYTYLELAFTSGAELLPQSSTGEIQTRVAKQDWSDFDESDDYSYLPSSHMIANPQITLYHKGVLICGKEPAVEERATLLQVEHKAGDFQAPYNNLLKPYFEIRNVGNTAISLGSIKLKYWFSPEDSSNINFWTDWAAMGKEKIVADIKLADTPYTGAEKYLELSFNTEDTLYSLSSTGEIRSRLATDDWSRFDETNDYSYQAGSTYNSNEHIGLYINNELVWGIEPGTGNTQRVNGTLSKNSFNAPLTIEGMEQTNYSAVLYPNPVRANASLKLDINQASNLQLEVISMTGQLMYAKSKTMEEKSQTLDVDMSHWPEGVYLLKVRLNEEQSMLRFIVQH